MSFGLIFWYEAVPPSVERATDVYFRLSDDEAGVVADNPRVDEFFSEVTSMYGDLTLENEDAPWTSVLYHTPACVIAQISWSRSREISSVLIDLAKKHNLTAFDPQDLIVYYPA